MNREHHIETDLKGNYLWVNREGIYGENFEETVLYKEKIPGLISFYEIENIGEAYLVYPLGYRKNFLQRLDGGRIQCIQMECFIKNLTQIMYMIDEYLLDPSNLVLEMDNIYEDQDGWACVYIPGYQHDFWKQMEKLSEEWLNYVDYGDERAVLWAYTFYEKVHGHGCSMEELVDILKLEKQEIVHVETVRIPEDVSLDLVNNFSSRRGSLKERVTAKILGSETKKKKASERKEYRREKKKEKRKSQKRKKRKNQAQMEVPEFFRKENSVEDTCPALELTADFGPITGKTLTLIPMGDTLASIHRIEKLPALIGRAPDEVDVCIEDTRISRIHARVDEQHGSMVLVDMNSINGTYRNGERLKAGESYSLHAGDIIKLADLEFICQWCA